MPFSANSPLLAVVILLVGRFATGAIFTAVQDISGNEVIGVYTDSSNVGHGFLYNILTSSYTTLDVPGAAGTTPTAIAGNKVVGAYADSSNVQHGFLYDIVTSTFATLDVPGASTSPGTTGTVPSAISGNNIAGVYQDASTGKNYGFLYDGSVYTTLKPSGNINTDVTGTSGDYVGGHTTDGGDHAFLYKISTSTYSVVSPPGAVETRNLGMTGDQVYGSYWAVPLMERGYLYDITTSSYTTLDGPEPSDRVRAVTGLSGNDVVGWFENGNGAHGFVYDTTTSDYTTLNASPTTHQTTVSGISGNNVVGTYIGDYWYGFVYDISTAKYTTLDYPEPETVPETPSLIAWSGLCACAIGLVALRRFLPAMGLG